MGGGVADGSPPYLGAKDGKNAIGAHRGLVALPKDVGEDDPNYGGIKEAKGVNLEPGPMTKKEKMKRHWKRFWCCYCLGNLIFLAILLPLVFTVILGGIAQMVVDKSDLVLVRASVMEPRADSVVITMHGKLDLGVAIPVKVSPMKLNLFVQGVENNAPYVTLDLPEATITGNKSVGVVNQYRRLENMDAWLAYVHDVVYLKEGILSVEGTSVSHIGALSSHVKLVKHLHEPMLNKFEGLSIEQSKLLVPARPDGVNLVANATIPNPSVLELQIGTVQMDVLSGDLVIGNATIDNLLLQASGNTTVPLEGILDLHTLIKNLRQVLHSQADNIKHGYLALTTKTKSVKYDGAEVTYYQKVLSTVPITAHVSIRSLLINTLEGIRQSGGSLGPLLTGGSDSSSSSSSTSHLENRLVERAVERMVDGMDESNIEERLTALTKMMR